MNIYYLDNPFGILVESNGCGFEARIGIRGMVIGKEQCTSERMHETSSETS